MMRFEPAPTPILPHGPCISTISQECIGRTVQGGSFGTSGGWPAANRALFFPVDLVETFTIAQAFAVFGASPTGNVDIGIYDADGNRLASTGSTSVSATSDLQAITLAYTLTAAPYAPYLAMACNSTSTLVYRSNSYTGGALTNEGVREMASAFPLPTTATFADVTSTYLPIFGVTKRATI